MLINSIPSGRVSSAQAHGETPSRIAQPPGEVRERFERLDQSIRTLEILQEDLKKELDPVLTPADESPQPDYDFSPALSPFAAHLESIDYRICALAIQLRTLSERLAIK